ncbi:unnamed protein product [Cuscuta campestris]|uniref:Integrase catalytic domain-containing protein n=1 Tax=Cuscuta campestris TaxID=132261 RepID=A0A484K2S8_9ASTE|nr:unnamed protein product [Cuscuta campestris]
MVQTRSNANLVTGNPHQGGNSATSGQHPPISLTETEALIQRVGITAEQFKEVMAALTPNHEVVVEDTTGEPTGGKAGPAGSGGKKKKTPQVKAYNGTTDPQDYLARFGANVVMYAYPKEIKCRWEKEARDFHGVDDQALIARLQVALPQGDVRKELRRNPLLTYQEMLARAKYLALEEEDDEPLVRKEKKGGPPVAEGKKRKDYGRGPNPTGYQANRHLVHAKQSLPAPLRSRESYGIQDAPKYCEYHRNNTHNMSKCVTLKREMDQLIARGPPPRPERPASGNRTWRRPAAPAAAIIAGDGQEDGRRHLGRDCDDLDEEERQNRRHLGCRFIMGGNTGGDSTPSRKKWKNMVHLAEVQRPPLPKQKKKEPLIFTDEDYPPVLNPHRDALVIKVEINNVVVHRTLVDTSSSVNIMYSNTIKELGLSRSDLKPIRTPLSGFTGDTIEAEGTIKVKAGVGDGTHRLWLDMEFMKEDGRPRAEPAEEVEEIALDLAEPEQKVKIGKALPGYYSVRFRFKVSNNEVEYEALLCGLRLVASLKAERIQVRCDSTLIAGHVTGEFEAKDEQMKMYRDTALELLKAFGAYRIEQVPREENAKADILSKLGPDSPDHIRAMTQEEELLEPSISPGQQIITDNGTQFEAKGFNEFLQSWGIKHSYAAVGYPQTNGQVENTNHTIVDGLKKKIMECKSAWVEELPYILWTYRTTPRKATGETPFTLTYGFEARAPAETSLSSYRVQTFDAQENEENLRAELHLIDERRERAYIRAENYRRQVKSYHDQRVRPRQFGIGDWVLREREVSRPIDGGKFAKSFEWPYIIKEMLADGTFRLQTPAGGDVPRVWNAANLIKFYQ